MNFNPANLQNGLLVALSNAAQYFVEKMKAKRSAQRLPDAIDRATSIDPPIANDKGASIKIKIDLNDAPMAAAFEWGSGQRATRGEARDYPIEAKNAPMLSFLWKYPSPLGRKYITSEDEHVRFKKVMHPGVAPRPYITPTIMETLPEIKRIIGREVKARLSVGGTTVIKV